MLPIALPKPEPSPTGRLNSRHAAIYSIAQDQTLKQGRNLGIRWLLAKHVDEANIRLTITIAMILLVVGDIVLAVGDVMPGVGGQVCRTMRFSGWVPFAGNCVGSAHIAKKRWEKMHMALFVSVGGMVHCQPKS